MATAISTLVQGKGSTRGVRKCAGRQLTCPRSGPEGCLAGPFRIATAEKTYSSLWVAWISCLELGCAVAPKKTYSRPWVARSVAWSLTAQQPVSPIVVPTDEVMTRGRGRHKLYTNACVQPQRSFGYTSPGHRLGNETSLGKHDRNATKRSRHAVSRTAHTPAVPRQI